MKVIGMRFALAASSVTRGTAMHVVVERVISFTAAKICP